MDVCRLVTLRYRSERYHWSRPWISMDLNHDNAFLNLPIEVRHKVYRHLFCKQAEPVWIVAHYRVFKPLHMVMVSQPDPIFETPLFRCCKRFHDDAVPFAYGANSFELRGDLSSFCTLNRLALSSIRNLSVTQERWTDSSQEEKTWQLIQQCCGSLEVLEIMINQDTLLSAIPILTVSRSISSSLLDLPKLALDLYVWDRHFQFDPFIRDLARSRDILQRSESREHLEHIIRKRLLRLPDRLQMAVLVADVTEGAVSAIDNHLGSMISLYCSKSSRDPPRFGPRAAGGRSKRFWYHVG